MSSVELRGVSKTYPGGVVGLHPTDLTVAAGERLVLLGPSGSGKSTLLRLIAGLDDPDAGEVRVADVRVDRLPPHRRGVAMLAQRPALYPHLTVGENIRAAESAHPAGSRGLSTQYSVLGSRDPAPEAPDPVVGVEPADLLGLTPLLGRYPHQLSGGERQRVALAKLLARRAGVWLLDEPFGALDPVFRSDFRHDLHLLLDRAGATMILVTHDPADAAALGSRVGVLGDGRLQQVGTPDELHRRPGTRFVAFCLGRLSLIDGRAAGRAGGGESSGPVFVSEDGLVSLPLPAWLTRRLGPNPPHNLTLGIRPEDVSPRPPGERPNPLRGEAVLTGWPVVTAEPVGSGWLLTVSRGRTRVRVGWSSGSPPPVGAPADWTLPADKCVWFDGPTGRRIDAG